MNGSQVRVLVTPADFYTTLKVLATFFNPTSLLTVQAQKEHIATAKRRISLSALYLGHTEHDLIETLSAAMAGNPELECTVLIDYLRGTRGDRVVPDRLGGGGGTIERTAAAVAVAAAAAGASKSSVTALAGLVARFPGRFKLALYHTPELRGWKKRLIPARFNEGIGLLHFKIFAADDRVMLSGANLSHDYFTNRQDRYMDIADAQVAEYFHGLVDICSGLSYQVAVKAEQTVVELQSPVHDPVRHPERYKQDAFARLTQFTAAAVQSQPVPAVDVATTTSPLDTFLVPLLQCYPLGVRDEERGMETFWRVLSSFAKGTHSDKQQWTVFFTSGYFNVTDGMQRTLLSFANQGGHVRLLTASPQVDTSLRFEANGFFNSRGISALIPAAYTHLEHKFFRRMQHVSRGSVALYEYVRTGWTYHAKGIWVSEGDKQQPGATVIGSSNFGQRSARRDLESQVLVVTGHAALRQQLQHETQQLWQRGEEVNAGTFTLASRRVAWYVRALLRPLQSMF
ncbi:CDP-diacylglycerol--glycerol-3-phosphate 3-phosphatidyltransferase [Sorochytrium milnesiophthora]